MTTTEGYYTVVLKIQIKSLPSLPQLKIQIKMLENHSIRIQRKEITSQPNRNHSTSTRRLKLFHFITRVTTRPEHQQTHLEADLATAAAALVDVPN
jgi:outer membrane protein assembly factor BamA